VFSKGGGLFATFNAGRPRGRLWEGDSDPVDNGDQQSGFPEVLSLAKVSVQGYQ